MKVETPADLVRLVERHQDFLSNDAIVGIVDGIPAGLTGTPEARFLRGVVAYHLTHKAAEKDWTGAGERFTGLPAAPLGSHLEFFRVNYLFLVHRNIGDPFEVLLPLAFHAVLAAQSVAEPFRSQLQGFVFYNWARFLLNSQPDPAAQAYLKTWPAAPADYYIHAGKLRIAYYTQVRGDADKDMVKNAATQVWKIRKDWAGFLPAVPVALCPVDEVLYAETGALADPARSAKK